jgi:hypothetical protein
MAITPDTFQHQFQVGDCIIAYDACNDGYGLYFDVFVFDLDSENMTYDISRDESDFYLSKVQNHFNEYNEFMCQDY